MKASILVDENNIVRCIATDECNLHEDKLHMDKYYVEMKGIPGDEYNSETDTWTPRPDNYPQPSEAEISEAKIQAEIATITRTMAIQNLKDRAELPAEYGDV